MPSQLPNCQIANRHSKISANEKSKDASRNTEHSKNLLPPAARRSVTSPTVCMSPRENRCQPATADGKDDVVSSVCLTVSSNTALKLQLAKM